MSRSVTPGRNNVSGVCGVAVFVLIRARQAVDLPRFFVAGVVVALLPASATDRIAQAL
jgi:hypothetical protein